MNRKLCQAYTASYQQSLYQNPCFLNTQFSVSSPFLTYFYFRTVVVRRAKKTLLSTILFYEIFAW